MKFVNMLFFYLAAISGSILIKNVCKFSNSPFRKPGFPHERKKLKLLKTVVLLYFCRFEQTKLAILN